MFEVDFEQGVKILEAFCRNKSQLHVRGRIKGELAWSPATIAEASPSRVRFTFFDAPDSEKYECEVPLAGAELWFDPTGTTAWVGSGAYEWRSSLRISYTDGTELVLGERLMTVH
jgi:hypothetical protein